MTFRARWTPVAFLLSTSRVLPRSTQCSIAAASSSLTPPSASSASSSSSGWTRISRPRAGVYWTRRVSGHRRPAGALKDVGRLGRAAAGVVGVDGIGRHPLAGGGAFAQDEPHGGREDAEQQDDQEPGEGTRHERVLWIGRRGASAVRSPTPAAKQGRAGALATRASAFNGLHLAHQRLHFLGQLAAVAKLRRVAGPVAVPFPLKQGGKLSEEPRATRPAPAARGALAVGTRRWCASARSAKAVAGAATTTPPDTSVRTACRYCSLRACSSASRHSSAGGTFMRRRFVALRRLLHGLGGDERRPRRPRPLGARGDEQHRPDHHHGKRQAGQQHQPRRTATGQRRRRHQDVMRPAAARFVVRLVLLDFLGFLLFLRLVRLILRPHVHDRTARARLL